MSSETGNAQNLKKLQINTDITQHLNRLDKTPYPGSEGNSKACSPSKIRGGGNKLPSRVSGVLLRPPLLFLLLLCSFLLLLLDLCNHAGTAAVESHIYVYIHTCAWSVTRKISKLRKHKSNKTIASYSIHSKNVPVHGLLPYLLLQRRSSAAPAPLQRRSSAAPAPLGQPYMYPHMLLLIFSLDGNYHNVKNSSDTHVSHPIQE